MRAANPEASTHEVRVRWIDALCINQSDLVERAEQVQQMTTIYEQAGKVLVWLGSEVSDPIRAAVQFFRDWPATRKFSLGGGKEIQSGTSDFAHSHYTTNDQLRGLYEILQSAWFKKVWVVQEIAVAKTVVISRGLTTGSDAAWMSWNTLVETNGHWMRAMLNNFDDDVMGFAQWTTQLGCMHKLRQSVVNGRHRRWPLIRPVRPGEAFDFTDPADEVFALLGMHSRRWQSFDLDPRLQPESRRSVPGFHDSDLQFEPQS